MADARGEPYLQDWPLRPWILAGFLALCGLAIHLLTQGHHDSAARVAAAGFFFFGGIAFALCLLREKWLEPAVFAAVIGVVMGGLAYHVVELDGRVAGEQFSFCAGIVATLLALPLFQAGFHRSRFSTPYRDTHFHLWSDAISGAGALAFVGLSWLLLLVLSSLFGLLKIDLLKDLMDEGWFGWMFSGAALGGALGVLRNELRVLGTLQQVVMAVFAILAVPLAAALVLFFIAVAVSGLDVLWEATRNATPLLLASAAGSFILANAIVRDADDAMSRSRIQRIAAMVLVLGILPLSLFAAVSMGLRIDQHGLSPERIWALIAIAVAVAYGLAGLVVVVRGRLVGWSGLLRRANLNLAVGVSAIALLLALPILDFGALSTRNQLARLSSGAVSADDFDYDALRWDFGDAGREALAKLLKSDNARIAELAGEAQPAESRPWLGRGERRPGAARLANLHSDIADPVLLEAVRREIRKHGWVCEEACNALDLGTDEKQRRRVAIVAGNDVSHYILAPSGDLEGFYSLMPGDETPSAAANAAPLSGKPAVEIRTETIRRIFVNGRPVGQPFK